METSLRVILDRLPRIRLDGGEDVRVTGAFNQILQGPNRLPVRFD